MSGIMISRSRYQFF